jgi:hypothetical protein
MHTRFVLPRLPQAGRRAAALGAAAGVFMCGCYSSPEPEDDECQTAVGCFDDAIVVCLDELATRPDDPDCREVEVVGSSDDCAESTGRVRVVRNAGGAPRTYMEGDIVVVPPGASLAGYFSPDESCDPCGGGGVTTDEPTQGPAFQEEHTTPEAVAVTEYVFLGRGVRYRLSLCALRR